MSGKNQSQQDQLDYEKKKSDQAKADFYAKYGTDKANIERQHDLTVKDLTQKFGGLTAGGNTDGMSKVQRALASGARLSTDANGNVTQTNADGSTVDLTGQYGTEGASMLLQAQSVEDSYQNNISQWQQKYSDASYQASTAIADTGGKIGASMSASGLSADSSSIAGQFQVLANQNRQATNQNASFLQAKGYMDKSYGTDESRLSTGFEILGNQAAQASKVTELQFSYQENTLANAKTSEDANYQLDKDYYKTVQDNIDTNANWSFASGILGGLEALGGIALMFLAPGVGTAIGASMIAGGLGGAAAGFSGQGGAGTIAQEGGSIFASYMMASQQGVFNGSNTSLTGGLDTGFQTSQNNLDANGLPSLFPSQDAFNLQQGSGGIVGLQF